MQPIFDVHPLVLLAVIVGITAVFLAIGHVALAVLHRTYRGDAQRLPVAPFFVAVTTPWALILGFLSADIWSAMHDAGEAVRNERAGLLRLESLAAPDVLDLPALLQGARAYSEAVLKIEWGQLRNRTTSPEVAPAYGRCGLPSPMPAATACAGRWRPS
jgi:hypothetical protein